MKTSKELNEERAEAYRADREWAERGKRRARIIYDGADITVMMPPPRNAVIGPLPKDVDSDA